MRRRVVSNDIVSSSPSSTFITCSHFSQTWGGLPSAAIEVSVRQTIRSRIRMVVTFIGGSRSSLATRQPIRVQTKTIIAQGNSPAIP